MVLADRYRIIGLIGRGGMGEVYRADDLKLGQPVALKFLPKALADDPIRRERLFAEVRIARQVSHPNICRVYDIGELEGRHFLTMEYIDGEDLASLLKRIGNLHGAKALDVARQLSAGLAAAHDKGVLHRDLKPANVMLDGRGRVRITDFGLAVAAGEDVVEADVSGTPPYMAPEQFAGKGASVRSDIYALGLVLYEVFTGRRAFEAKTLAELRAKKEGASPTAPSELVRDIDPVVERVILRCIEKDPRQRPTSVMQVAAALPGGDPLAAAIAAGETPSPEMVAASGSTDGLKPWIAWTCLAFILVGIIGAFVWKRQTALFILVPLEKEPQVLAEKARDILRDLGYPEPPADSVFRYTANRAYSQYVQKNSQSPTRFEKLPALAVLFWYRQSPERLVHSVTSDEFTPTDPPLINNGESVVWLDSRGNLCGLRVIPPGEAKPTAAVPPPDWSALFRAANLDRNKWASVEPDLAPLPYADMRAAWTGTLPDLPDVPIRIEAAAWQGKPVSWRLVMPTSEGPSPFTAVSSETPLAIFSNPRFVALLILIIVGVAIFARRNLRMGRGDRRGATRLACFLFAVLAIEFVFREHLGGVLRLLGAPIAYWLLYIALEPFVRRHWPGVLVGWSRLIAGSYRDPVVGRDLLVGCAAGAGLAMLSYLGVLLASLFGAPQAPPSTGIAVGTMDTLYLFSGTRAVIVGIAYLMCICTISALFVGFLLFLMRSLLRSTWAAAIVCILVFTAVYFPTGKVPPIYLIPMILMPIVLSSVIQMLIILRFGLLAIVAEQFFFSLLSLFPITTQMSAWYFGIGLTGLVILLALSLYAFHTSLGGQPMFGRVSLED
jgi:serine/threonine-protein kinase